MFALVSTTSIDYFVRLFPTKDAAVTWALNWIVENYGDEALGKETGEAALEEFQDSLESTEWLHIWEVTEDIEKASAT